MKIIYFKDPITGKSFEAKLMITHAYKAYLVPLWVKSRPESWIRVNAA